MALFHPRNDRLRFTDSEGGGMIIILALIVAGIYKQILANSCRHTN